MTVAAFDGLVFTGAAVAGLLGALTGLGGGVVIVPLLALGFGVNIRYAVGASLVSVIATSSGAAAAYVREGFTNIRIGMLLEVGTTIGALGGAWLAGVISTNAIAVIFAVVLLYSAWLSSRRLEDVATTGHGHPWSRALRLAGTYPGPDGAPRPYRVENVPAGLGIMVGAGALSGLLGIGSGALKVLAMDNVMRLPFKVSTTTSNFMIGVTAAASAGIYLHRGWIDPGISFAVMLGVLLGATGGARVLPHVHTGRLRKLMGFVVVALALELLYKGLRGGL